MGMGHSKSDERLNCFKGHVEVTSVTQDEGHVGFSERTDTILS